MTSFFTPRTSDGRLFEEEQILIAIWVSWLSGCPAIANQHSLRLRKALGKDDSTACRKALLARNWEDAFNSELRAMLSYAEFQTRHTGKFSAEHRARLTAHHFTCDEIQQAEELIHQVQLACKTGNRNLLQSKGGKVCRSRRRYGRAATRGNSAYRPTIRTMHNRFHGC